MNDICYKEILGWLPSNVSRLRTSTIQISHINAPIPIFEDNIVAGEVWKKTPYDIIDKIVRYTGKMRLRNRVFMNQLDTNDMRYTVLQTIPEKIYTYDPISNVHITTVYFTPRKNDMDKIVVRYEHKYELPHVLHTLYKHSIGDWFHGTLDWIE
jgi:hypothetical protein